MVLVVATVLRQLLRRATDSAVVNLARGCAWKACGKKITNEAELEKQALCHRQCNLQLVTVYSSISSSSTPMRQKSRSMFREMSLSLSSHRFGIKRESISHSDMLSSSLNRKLW